MPSKGRTRQAHVKCQDTSGGPDRRANGKDCFLRRGTFGIGETAGVSACVGKGTVETQRKSTGLGLYQTESDTEFGFWEAHPCSYLSDEDVAVLRAFRVRSLRQVVGGRTPIARNEESWSASLQVLHQGSNTCSDAITPYVAKSLYCPAGLISKVRVVVGHHISCSFWRSGLPSLA
jgi:hypothetical protein